MEYDKVLESVNAVKTLNDIDSHNRPHRIWMFHMIYGQFNSGTRSP